MSFSANVPNNFLSSSVLKIPSDHGIQVHSDRRQTHVKVTARKDSMESMDGKEKWIRSWKG